MPSKRMSLLTSSVGNYKLILQTSMSVTSPVELVSHNNLGSLVTLNAAAESSLGSSTFQTDNLLI